MDDILSSHQDPKVNDQFLKELNALYGKLKECTSHRGKVHDFLGMTLKFKENGTVEIWMEDHIKDFIEACPQIGKNPGVAPTPASKSLFNVDETSKLLDEKDKESFHSCVAKGLFIGKRGRPDIAMPIVVLSSRVTKPTISDREKLIRIVKYLRGSRKLCLTRH